jgi:hypothetical protein
MTNHEQLTTWAIDRGFKLNGIRARSFPGRGLGIVAEKNIEVGHLLSRGYPSFLCCLPEDYV